LYLDLVFVQKFFGFNAGFPNLVIGGYMRIENERACCFNELVGGFGNRIEGGCEGTILWRQGGYSIIELAICLDLLLGLDT
jgi:hypothetical protein